MKGKSAARQAGPTLNISCGLGNWGFSLRLVLGNVELLGLPKMGVHHTLGRLRPRIRDAPTGLRGLFTFRVGSLRWLPFFGWTGGEGSENISRRCHLAIAIPFFLCSSNVS